MLRVSDPEATIAFFRLIGLEERRRSEVPEHRYTLIRAVLLEQGKLERANPYGGDPSVTYRDFWLSGEQMRLLFAPVDTLAPVRLVVGEKDGVVPIGVTLKLLEQLRSADVHLKIIKNSGHNLSEPHELHAILVELHNLVELAQ